MTNIYYQGEDIPLGLELFEDDLTPISLTGKDITILAYTKIGGKKVVLSTKDNTLTSSEYQLTGTIKPKDSRELEDGVLIIEIAVGQDTPQLTTATNITVKTSRIGQLKK